MCLELEMLERRVAALEKYIQMQQEKTSEYAMAMKFIDEFLNDDTCISSREILLSSSLGGYENYKKIAEELSHVIRQYNLDKTPAILDDLIHEIISHQT